MRHRSPPAPLDRCIQCLLSAAFLCATVYAADPPLSGQGAASSRKHRSLPPLEKAAASKRDVWGEAAMAERNGASYEFFEDLLPPPRYVNADFRYYPIVLSAPNAKVKARLISNGSGINSRGGTRSWDDSAVPVTFRVGPDEFLFGGLQQRLGEPSLAEGYLPIVEIRYLHPSPFQTGGNVPLDAKRVNLIPEVYRLEAFASTDPTLAESGLVLVRFSLTQGTNGQITVEVDPRSTVTFADGRVRDEKGRVLAVFDSNWKWDHGSAHARIRTNAFATVAIPTKPLAENVGDPAFLAPGGAWSFEEERMKCVQTWKQILAEGMNVEIPEPRVNDAWRHLIIQNLELVNGDRIHYSSGNQYDKLYEAEGSDAALAALVWGREADMRRLMGPLLEFTRKGLEFHQAGFKLNDICHYYWQTRDASVIRELRAGWMREASRLADNRTGPHGLYPKEQYCGDISTPVQSLNANAKAWRALRDLSAVLAETGEASEARHYAEIATAFKREILAALDQSIRHETKPPFVPVGLFGVEPTHDPICHARIGGYWNIIIGYTIGSGIFPPGSKEENWIPEYQEQHGGLFMGMLRAGAGGAFTFWNSTNRINPLYGTRYALDTLRRDVPERVLVSFYGMLAQGLTRNTFEGGEGCALEPIDPGGRLFFCPPNSAGNAHLLSMLRYMLVQDWDLDDDGKPETLRLLFGTSKRWLEDGKTIKVERAPTAFGPLSMTVRSDLRHGQVVADVDLPQRNQPKQTLLRIRVPDGWKVVAARAGNERLKPDNTGAVDISSLRGMVTINFQTRRS